MSYARFDRSVYQNISLMNKLKMFDWNAEFGNRKFDAIIGNPPYIRVQNMVHYSREEYDFIRATILLMLLHRQILSISITYSSKKDLHC